MFYMMLPSVAPDFASDIFWSHLALFPIFLNEPTLGMDSFVR